MLRTIVPTEPELIRLCRTKNWAAVSQRSQNHPFEATPSVSAFCGESATALSLAVRLGAPTSVLKALVKACIEQVGVVHRRGSVLTEALKYRASDEAVDFLLKAVVHYQATSHNNRVDVLGTRDDWGRTALHYMVERVKGGWERGDQSAYNWCIFRDLLQARPESIQVLDTDGNTPLVLLLLVPRVPDHEAPACIEEGILRMVRLMVTSCPWAAAISRRLPEPWHSIKQVSSYAHQSFASGVQVDGSPSPLYYAILHGRCLETINIIIDANRKVGVNACATIISQYHEIPLHTAISTQASMPIITRLVREWPESVLCADSNGLTPLDWIWIRHVVDWHTNNTPHTLVSRGRYLAGSFFEWHRSVSQEMAMPRDAADESSVMIDLPQANVKTVTRDLLSRMELLLPTAVAYAAREHICKSWSLLHITCYVPCPLAMVHLALEYTNQEALERPDYQQRLPLHWAAARFGYTANFPVGVTRITKRLVESTPVPILVARYEPACAVVDGNGQLPLHIAIDTARHYRQVSRSARTPRLTTEEVDAMEDEMLDVLISSYPESLECMDGKSGLLPFQQAAIGSGARLTTIFTLFRHLPTLLEASR